MEMMYTLIAEAIKEEELEGRYPTDYLNFFCLGNRELKRANEPPPSVAPVEGSSQVIPYALSASALKGLSA